MKVLFVCSGNICRSPMAAAYLRERVERAGRADIAVDSAGLLGIEGAPAAREACKVVAGHGVDLSAHRSRGFTDEDARSPDLLIAMERDHLVELRRRFPGAPVRPMLLRSFEAQPVPQERARDLDDPIGQSLDQYRECFAVIRVCVDNLCRHLGIAE